MDNTFRYISGTLWKDENFDLSSLHATAGDAPDVIALNGTAIEVAAFDGNNTTEEVSMCKELNHDYREKTHIQFHVHWMPSTANAGDVTWRLDYYAVHNALPTTVVSGTLTVTQSAGGVAWYSNLVNFSEINLAPLDIIGTQLHFRFYRIPTGSDTYPDDAAVSTLGYHYQTNSRGSAQISSK